MRVLIVSLSTYTSDENRGKLESLAEQVGSLSVITGDVPTIWGTASQPSAEASSYVLHVLPCRLTWSWATRWLRGFGRAARSTRPDVVHVEAEPWQVASLQALAFAKRNRTPFGIHFAEDGMQLHGASGHIRRLVMRAVLRSSDYAIGWSEQSAGLARHLAPRVPVFTMPGTGLDASHFATVRPGPAESSRWFGEGSEGLARVAFVGRLVPEKGIYDFMEVCDALAERLDLRAAIAGKGQCEEEVRAWARDKRWVHFHGVVPRSDVSRCFACADLLLVPSRSVRNWKEQFGKVAVEAMGVGTPVLGYESGALREVVAGGGLLVAEGDVRALVREAERYLLLPPQSQQADRAEARKRAQDFSSAGLAERLVRLWTDL